MCLERRKTTMEYKKNVTTRGSGRERRRDASREKTDENGFWALLRTASSAFVSVGCHYRIPVTGTRLTVQNV